MFLSNTKGVSIMNTALVRKIGWVALGTMATQVAMAEYGFVGARGSAMGGANVVSTRDASAQYYNPAAFGFMHREEHELDRSKMGEQDFGWSVVDLGVGATLTGDMGRYLDLFTDIDFELFDGDGLTQDPEAVKSMLSIGTTLTGLSKKDTAYVDANVGTAFRFGRLGIGIRVFGEGVAYVEADTGSIGIGQSADEFVDAINSASTQDSAYNAFNPANGVLKDDQKDALAANLNGDMGAVNYIDYQLAQLKEEGYVSDADINRATDFVANSVEFGDDTFAENDSVAVGRAFGVVEIPVSYGWSFLDNSLSIGATAKGMYGTVTGTKVWFFDPDSVEDAVDVTTDNTEATMNFGFDLGAQYRWSMFQFGAVGRNLNAPTFSGFTDTVEVETGTRTRDLEIDIPDHTLDPQVTLGAAFVPSRRFMVEVNYDVLETGTLLEGYDIQRLSFGSELDIWLLALRLGAYQNMALDDADWVLTGGIGANLFGIRADIGGAYSLGDSITYEDTDLPPEARIFASISLDY